VVSNVPDTDDESDLKEWFLENVDTNELRDHYSPIEDDLTRKCTPHEPRADANGEWSVGLTATTASRST